MTTHPATPDQSTPVGKTPVIAEALRLADELDGYTPMDPGVWPCREAAAELRRLHAAKQRWMHIANERAVQVATLRTNAALSAAAPAAPQAEQPGERGQVIRDLYAAAQRTEPGDTLLAITNAIQHLQAEHPSHPTRNMDSTAGVQAQAGAESYPPSDVDIDRILSTPIPGGSSARDWFLPHEQEKGLRNVRDVVRRMMETAAALRARGAVPSGWKQVPVEITDGMADAAADDHQLGKSAFEVSAARWKAMLAAAPAAPMSAQGAPFQQRVQPWMMECFGPMIAGDREERNHRFIEEALELVQATGCSPSEAHQLVDYVFGRPVGEPAQEVGGVMVTLAALCLANDLDMHTAAETELSRIWTKVEAIRAKQAAKPKHSPLPTAAPGSGVEQDAAPTDAMVDAYLQTQRRAVEEADKFGRPNVGGLHTNTVREACRAGIAAAIAAAKGQEGGA